MKISQHQLCTHFTPALIHATFHDEPRAPRAGTPIAVVLRVLPPVELVDAIRDGSGSMPLGLMSPCGKGASRSMLSTARQRTAVPDLDGRVGGAFSW